MGVPSCVVGPSRPEGEGHRVEAGARAGAHDRLQERVDDLARPVGQVGRLGDLRCDEDDEAPAALVTQLGDPRVQRPRSGDAAHARGPARGDVPGDAGPGPISRGAAHRRELAVTFGRRLRPVAGELQRQPVTRRQQAGDLDQRAIRGGHDQRLRGPALGGELVQDGQPVQVAGDAQPDGVPVAIPPGDTVDRGHRVEVDLGCPRVEQQARVGERVADGEGSLDGGAECEEIGPGAVVRPPGGVEHDDRLSRLRRRRLVDRRNQDQSSGHTRRPGRREETETGPLLERPARKARVMSRPYAARGRAPG